MSAGNENGGVKMDLFSKEEQATEVASSGGVVVQLDVFAAIQAHVQWKQRLLKYINGESEEKLDPEVVGSDCRCALGEWIHSEGEEKYGEHAKFQSLKAIHSDFHTHAAEVVFAVDRGESEHALKLLQNGDYPKISNRIKSMLAGLSLEFEFT
jgi:hypothetical protein